MGKPGRALAATAKRRIQDVAIVQAWLQPAGVSRTVVLLISSGSQEHHEARMHAYTG